MLVRRLIDLIAAGKIADTIRVGYGKVYLVPSSASSKADGEPPFYILVRVNANKTKGTPQMWLCSCRGFRYRHDDEPCSHGRDTARKDKGRVATKEVA